MSLKSKAHGILQMVIVCNCVVEALFAETAPPPPHYQLPGYLFLYAPYWILCTLCIFTILNVCQ